MQNICNIHTAAFKPGGNVEALRYFSEFSLHLSANGSFMYTGRLIKAVRGAAKRRSKSVC